MSMAVKKLAGLSHLSDSQIQVIDHLWRMTGVCCACERPLEESNAKMAMGVINTRYCAIPAVRNTIGISLYCARCTEAINNLLRSLKPVAANGQAA